MSIQNTCRYISIATFSCLMWLLAVPVLAQSDTPAVDSLSTTNLKKHDSAGRQLCLGIDVVRIGANSFYNDRYAYEFQVDYYARNEFYLAAEGGWGGSKVNYDDLKYTTTNSFVQFGFNKSILSRSSKTDWDMMMMGMRAGFANVNRSPVTYTVVDSVWGNTGTQSIGPTSFPVFWLEVTGGMRVEILRGLFAGWNIRGKFVMNGKSFRDLSPLFIAGYGKGDKNANFDFNLYISYGIRWNRKGPPAKTKS